MTAAQARQGDDAAAEPFNLTWQRFARHLIDCDLCRVGGTDRDLCEDGVRLLRTATPRITRREWWTAARDLIVAVTCFAFVLGCWWLGAALIVGRLPW